MIWERLESSRHLGLRSVWTVAGKARLCGGDRTRVFNAFVSSVKETQIRNRFRNSRRKTEKGLEVSVKLASLKLGMELKKVQKQGMQR